MKLKKSSISIIMFVLILTVSLSLASCGSKDAGGDANTDSNTSGGSESTEPAGDPTVLKLGSTITDDSPGGKLVIEYFKPEIEKRSNGQIIVEIYNNAVLGGDRELYEALQLGTLQLSMGPLSVLTNFDAKFGISDLPFLYKDKPTAYAALDGEWGEKLSADLPQQGMRVLAYCENAFRNVSNNSKPIEKLEDLKGMKIRVMESPIHISTFKALGATPTPLAFNELYTALQNGTVDGQDNGVALTYSSKLYEVQKYYTFTGQCYAASAFVVSESWWNTLSPELQEIVAQVTKETCDKQRAANTAAEEENIEQMKEAGVIVNEISDAEKEKFREATSVVWDEFADTYGKELMAAAKELNEKYAQ